MTSTAIVLGQPLGRQSLNVLRRWLTDSGINPDDCSWHTLVTNRDAKESEVKQDVSRVLGELDAIPDLKAVIAVGRYGVRLDTDLWRGGINRCHGHSGSLLVNAETGRKVNAIAMKDPYSYVRNVQDGNSRRAVEEESSAKLILSRLRTMDATVIMPEVRERSRVLVSGLVGLDTETTQDQKLFRRINKSPSAKVDARASTLKMVGLSNGDLSFNGADFADDAEPVAYNMPFDAIITGNWSAKWHDPKMLAHLLGEKDTEMKSLALRWLGRPMMHYDEAGGTDKEPAYCVADSQAHLGLLEEGYRRAPAGIRSLYDNIERPMLRLFARWSMEGVFALDRPAAQALYDRQLNDIESLAATIRQLTGIENPDSTDEVAAYVFKWDPKTDPQKTKKPSVDVKSLTPMIGKVRGVKEILERRALKKQASTYLGTWLDWPFDKLGCMWRGTGAWTGRPSVAALQLHNVPPKLRHFLVPPPGKVLRTYDNSQLEVRIAAHISGDPNMISLLRGEMPGFEDADIHRWATKQLGVTNRTFGKIGVFSGLYGGTENAIIAQAAKYGVTVEEIRPHASHINRSLPRMFPVFFRWANRVAEMQRVPGLFGAVLIPPPHGDANTLRNERINCSIQRGAVDVVKVQTLALEAAGFKTVHQIHDEVIIELDEADDTEETHRTITDVMTKAVVLDVPLKVEGNYWGQK